MFIISKMIGFLLDPFKWFLVLALLAMFLHDDARRRMARMLAIIVFIIFSNPYLVDRTWNAYQCQPVSLPAGKTYQTGIVLGGMAGYDSTVRRGFFSGASDRFIQTARLYHNGCIRKILVSGGEAFDDNGNEYNEADFIAQQLIDLRVAPSDILTEGRSRNTSENAKYSKAVLDSAHVSGSYLLITSALHMPRALKHFRKQGISADPYPVHFQVLPVHNKFTWRSLIPSPDVFYKWQLLLKEWAGTLVV